MIGHEYAVGLWDFFQLGQDPMVKIFELIVGGIGICLEGGRVWSAGRYRPDGSLVYLF